MADKKGDTADQATDLTVEQQFQALLEIEDTQDKDLPTPPDATDDDDDGDQQSGDADALDDDDDSDVNDDVDEDDDEVNEDVDDDDESDDEDDSDEDEEFMFKVPGIEDELPADEVVKGYLRQNDYTHKTEELARQREALAEDSEAVRQERAKYAQLLDKMEATVESLMPKQPDWDALKKSDPTQYAIQREEWRDQQDKLKAIQAEREQVTEQDNMDTLKAMQARAAEERTKLVEKIPEWKDEKKYEAGSKALAAYATTELGLTTEELRNILDHRAVIAIHKSMLYDQLQGKKPVVRKKAKGAPTLKPGAQKRSNKKGNKSKRARARLKDEGSIEAASQTFLAMLDG